MIALSMKLWVPNKVVVTYPFLLYIALFLILSTFYEKVYNQYLKVTFLKVNYRK